MNKKTKWALFSPVFVLAAIFLAGCWPKADDTKTEEMEKAPAEGAIMKEEATGDEMMKNEEIETGRVLYTDVTPIEAKKMIDEKPELVVVDASPNYAEGHLPGAVNYYVGDGSLEKVIPTLDKTKDYLVYCHFESASRTGAAILTDAKFKNVYRLDGDYPAWVAAGYEVEK